MARPRVRAARTAPIRIRPFERISASGRSACASQRAASASAAVAFGATERASGARLERAMATS